MLEQEFQYYIDHQDDLVKEYNNKHIVIQGEKVIGSYNSHGEAYNETVKKEKLGTFLIQHCFPGERSYTEYILSHWVIDTYDSDSTVNSETIKTEKLGDSRMLHLNSSENYTPK